MSKVVPNIGTIMDGRKLSQKILENVQAEIEKNQYDPRLIAIIIGEDKGSYIYQRMKERKFAEVGIRYSLYAFNYLIDPSKIKELILKQNENKDITGIMVQLPLPPKYNENEILELIKTEKDIDGLNFINIGRSYYTSDVFVPCAAEGLRLLLKAYNIEVKGKKAVVLGRGRLIGTPVAQLLEKENAFVTKIHSIVDRDRVNSELRSADIVISATGKPKLIDAEILKEGVIAIDCANTKTEREFTDLIFEKASFVSTVPGGLGPLTIAVLIKNTLKAYKRFIGVLK
ncbi:MAG: bifunctional 5,10-methylenetetrahydrofolate dehydrogenase/5,10-methenyltetrahydrofolate cyclohydrolase [Candidatus Hodarchaeales archaeon]|jgi:methylenetetrahydrofolate dehydrogenase (NADP+)/methenyltetrahydrofolate cyclohydrolase